jgi:hypothetical protein
VILFFTKYYYADHIKKDEKDEARRTYGEMRNTYKIFVGKPEGR